MTKHRAWQDQLSRKQMLGILAVLDQCEESGGGHAFKEGLVDAISTYFGVRDVTFFHGRTFPDIFDDPAPLLTGAASPLLPTYHDRWRDKDIFALPLSRRVLTTSGFASLDELSHLPSPQRSYVVDYLRPHDMYTASALHLPLADGEALIGMFGTVRPWDESDLVAMRVLARQLRTRTVTVAAAEQPVDPLKGLTPRQFEVAELVSDGLSNSEIAERLFLSELSVKKYISRIFDTTGHRNRSELAIAVLRRGHRSQARRGQGPHRLAPEVT
ncbi:helix-turn-helix transcriptional regulator [Rhodococcus artemisiae]|uniref:LuxR C-terminal-related transcriptional regulator n=1 Tax=Rhodococcus artemisiae TaxID=714159 RepID=A0ABU7LJB0_9NOCA|nr:LuxR C-terminal-related transcriptional regulator [Rhodococcus artemisiae]MEE2061653.1 LuxR C-terminal-related transcriptional regulator [Rhodococcus artemisiae]